MKNWLKFTPPTVQEEATHQLVEARHERLHILSDIEDKELALRNMQSRAAMLAERISRIEDFLAPKLEAIQQNLPVPIPNFLRKVAK